MFCRFVLFVLTLVFIFVHVSFGHLPEENDIQKQNQKSTTPASTSSYEEPSDDDAVPSSTGECGLDTNGDRIYGGEFTELDEFPWLALLGYRKPSGKISYMCGGSLINHRYVLTAAHCITHLINEVYGVLVTVRLGEYNTTSEVDCVDGVCADPPQEIPVQGAYPHPEFSNKNTINDIGLVRLSRRAKYTYFVKPLCLPDVTTSLNTGSFAIVAGWGKTLADKYSPVKQKLKIPIFDKNECTSKFNAIGVNLNENQLCAGGELFKDACSGDSGGPLMVKNGQGYLEAIGIVSFGNQCGRDGWAGVYTSVTGYIDWILSTMKKTNS